MVHDQPSCPFIPAMGAFHHPSLGQWEEAIGIGLQLKQLSLPRAVKASHGPVGRMPDHLNRDAMVVVDRLGALARVGAVDKQGFNRRILCRCSRYRLGRGIAVLKIGRRDTDGEDQPQGIDHQAALATLHLLAGVIAAGSTLVLYSFFLSLFFILTAPG